MERGKYPRTQETLLKMSLSQKGQEMDEKQNRWQPHII